MVLVKVSSPRWQIKEADILRGLRWVIDTRRRLNIRIVNLSVGGDFVSNDPSHPIYRAIKKLHDAGVVVLAAAGNSGAEMIVPPASSPHAITIGGFNDHNSRNPAEWSGYHNNYGITYNGAIKPDVVTQAVWIPSPILPDSRVALEARWLAPLLNGHRDDALERIRTHGYHDLGLTKEQIKSGDNALRQALQNRINSHKLIDAHHQHVDGTSVSVAIASSIVAQMLEANPALSPEQVSAILSDTARAVPGDPERQGAGRIDAAAAVKRAVESV
jgi:serine protease AprX